MRPLAGKLACTLALAAMALVAGGPVFGAEEKPKPQ